jgi:hypothetical protein
MTCTAVNPNTCCNWPRQEDAHVASRPPPHPHASTHLTNNDRLQWRTDGLPPANGPPTTSPQQRHHSPSTPARGPPRPPTPRPSPQPPTLPSKSQGQVPIMEQNFSKGSPRTQPPTHIRIMVMHLLQLTMHISTNYLHCCKLARLLQRATSGGRPRHRPPPPPPLRSEKPHQKRQTAHED